MSISKKLVTSTHLLLSSLQVLTTHVSFLVISATIALLLIGTYMLMPALGIATYLWLPLASFISTVITTFCVAIIIHQAAQLPGGHIPSLVDSIKLCLMRCIPLLAWASIESVIRLIGWNIQIHHSINFIFMVIWHTLTITIVPIIVDTELNFIDVVRQSLIIIKNVWIEALAGVALIGIGMNIITSYTEHNLSSLTTMSLFMIVQTFAFWYFFALVLTFSALFKEQVYRYSTRSNRKELDEAQFPFF